MKGRAFELLRAIYDRHAPSSARRSFSLARVILSARVIPEDVTPELDDPDLEARLEEALARTRDTA